MKYYVITKNCQLVGITYEDAYAFGLDASFSIHEFDGTVPDLNTHVWNDSMEDFSQGGTIITKYQFLARFSMTERVAIRASTDPIVNDFMKILEVVENIDVTNQDTINGVQYLVYAGLITPARAGEILT